MTIIYSFVVRRIKCLSIEIKFSAHHVVGNVLNILY